MRIILGAHLGSGVTQFQRHSILREVMDRIIIRCAGGFDYLH
jgi:hypothetical protein